MSQETAYKTFIEKVATARDGQPTQPVERCKGCAGLGVDISRSPREMQLIDGPFRLVKAKPNGGELQRFVRVTAQVSRSRGVVHGPLALIVEHMKDLHKNGFREDPNRPIAFDMTWACKWCHGTGQPQLSIQSLTLAVGEQTKGEE